MHLQDFASGEWCFSPLARYFRYRIQRSKHARLTSNAFLEQAFGPRKRVAKAPDECHLMGLSPDINKSYAGPTPMLPQDAGSCYRDSANEGSRAADLLPFGNLAG